MKKLYMSAVLLCTTAVLYAQDVVWQKDIKSSGNVPELVMIVFKNLKH